MWKSKVLKWIKDINTSVGPYILAFINRWMFDVYLKDIFLINWKLILLNISLKIKSSVFVKGTSSISVYYQNNNFIFSINAFNFLI